jgi:hypothetical protein
MLCARWCDQHFKSSAIYGEQFEGCFEVLRADGKQARP